jgi:hypothetical protein
MTMAKRVSLWVTFGQRQVQVGSYDTAAEAEAVQARMLEAGAAGVTVVDAGAPDGDALAGQVGLPWPVLRQPPSLDAEIEALDREMCHARIEAAARLFPVEGALRVWGMQGRRMPGGHVWGAPVSLGTCSTMEHAQEIAEGTVAAGDVVGDRWVVVIVDGRSS